MQSLIDLLKNLDCNTSGKINVVLTRFPELAYLLELGSNYNKSTNEFFDVTDGKAIKEYLSVCKAKPFMIPFYSLFCALDNSVKPEVMVNLLKNTKNTSGLILIKDYRTFKELEYKFKDTEIKFYNYYSIFKKDKLALFRLLLEYEEGVYEYFETRIAWDTPTALSAIVQLYNKQELVTLEIIKQFRPEVADIQYLLIQVLEGSIRPRGKFMGNYYIAHKEFGASYIYTAFRNTIQNLIKFKYLELEGLVSSRQFYDLQSDVLEEHGLKLSKPQFYKLVTLGDIVTLKELSYISQYFMEKFCSESEVIARLLIIGTRKGIPKSSKGKYMRKKGKKNVTK